MVQLHAEKKLAVEIINYYKTYIFGLIPFRKLINYHLLIRVGEYFFGKKPIPC